MTIVIHFLCRGRPAMLSVGNPAQAVLMCIEMLGDECVVEGVS
jgi:hypothetical protein